MKVKIDNEIYLVHWTTRKFKPKFGDIQKELIQTTCFLRKLEANGEKVDLDWGIVHQNYRDKCNNVIARKLAFAEAIKPFNKATRCVFWDEYKKVARLTKRTMRVKNSMLRSMIVELQSEINELKKHAVISSTT